MQILKLQILFLSAVIASLIFVSPSLGHKPFFVDQNTSSYLESIEIKDIQISNAIYDELPSGKYIKYFKFVLTPNDTIQVSILVPKLEGYEDFNVGLVVMNERIAKNFPRVPVDLIKSEEFSIVDYENKEGENILFFEPFTQTTYYERQSFNLTTLNKSVYYMAIFDRNAEGGKYVLAIGNEEKFVPSDVITFPYNFLRIRFWYKDYATVFVVISLIILAVGFVLHKKTKIFKSVLKWKLKSKRKKKSKE